MRYFIIVEDVGFNLNAFALYLIWSQKYYSSFKHLFTFGSGMWS